MSPNSVILLPCMTASSSVLSKRHTSLCSVFSLRGLPSFLILLSYLATQFHDGLYQTFFFLSRLMAYVILLPKPDMKLSLRSESITFEPLGY